MCRKKAGEFLHYVSASKAINLEDSDILTVVRCHTAGSFN